MSTTPPLRRPVLPSIDVGQAFARLTPRERALVAGLFATALLGLVYVSFQWATDRRDAYLEARAERLEARARVRTVARTGVSALQRAQLNDLEGLSIEARTLSIARILVERKLITAAERAGVAAPSIRVSDTVEPNLTIPVISAELSAAYAPGAFVTLLETVASEPEAAFVGSVSVTPAAPSAGQAGQMRVVFLFPLSLDEGERPR